MRGVPKSGRRKTKSVLDKFSKQQVVEALDAAGTAKQAAQALEVSETTLRRLAEKYELALPTRVRHSDCSQCHTAEARAKRIATNLKKYGVPYNIACNKGQAEAD